MGVLVTRNVSNQAALDPETFFTAAGFFSSLFAGFVAQLRKDLLISILFTQVQRDEMTLCLCDGIVIGYLMIIIRRKGSVE